MIISPTPIIYGLDFAQTHLEASSYSWLTYVYYLNPLCGILELYRAGLFNAAVNQVAVLSSVVVTAVVLLLGHLVFVRLERDVLKEI